MVDETVTTIMQLEAIQPKMHFKGKVVKITLAGAIVDIGLEVPGVIHISQLQKEPVKRVEDILEAGQEVEVWVRRVYPKKSRIELTMIKPLDLEWRELEKDLVVKGKVTRLEKFGVFVDIGAERPGLVHISELTHGYVRTPGELVKEGDEVEVKVLEVNRQKKQIRLSMKALEEKPETILKAVQAKVEKKEKEKPVEEAQPEKELPPPTSMEAALREAMERVETVENVSTARRKSKTSRNDLEDILRRTLNNKTPTRH
jgi:small subunit ribosomal protein S1